MITPFGKALRTIRIDRELKLLDLAKKMEYSTAFLSAVETGRKPIPPQFIDKVSSAITLKDRERKKLEAAAADTVKTITLNVKGVGQKKRAAALAFARKFEGLTEDQMKELVLLLNKTDVKV